MPKTEQHHIKLPPARLSPQHLIEIDDALPSNFQGNLSWIMWADKHRYEEYLLKELLDSVKGEQGINEFALLVETEHPMDITLELYCEEKGSFLEYSCPTDRAVEMQNLARVVVSVFTEHRLRGWWLPWRAPKLAFGGQPPPKLQISWSRIVENVITNWLSYLFILATGLILGYILRGGG